MRKEGEAEHPRGGCRGEMADASPSRRYEILHEDFTAPM